MSKTKLLICSSGLGAGKKGAELGPFALRIASENGNYMLFKDKELSILENDHRVYSNSSKFKADYLEKILEFNNRICNEVAKISQDDAKIIVMSGDHSNAVGSISGLRKSYPNAKIGLVWIDAHADLHSPYSTPSFNIHGMPLAALCGLNNVQFGEAEPVADQIFFWNKLKEIGGKEISPKIAPNDIVFISIRDLEKPEWDVVNNYKIPYFSPEKIKEIGINTVIEKTKESLKDKDIIYITFDVDSLDPSISCGTGTPVKNGLQIEEAAALIRAFYHDERCKMLEITEINPLLDTNNRMALAALNVLTKAGIY